MMGIYPARYKLPVAYCTEIGRIVTRFAVLESRLEKCVWTLLRLSPKQGRVAVRIGRIESALTAIQDLLTIAKLSVAADFPKLKKNFKRLEEARDLLSHGLWVKHAGSKIPVIQKTSGSYASTEDQSVRARINPQGLEVPLAQLKMTTKAIDLAVKAVDRLGAEIDAASTAASP